MSASDPKLQTRRQQEGGSRAAGRGHRGAHSAPLGRLGNVAEGADGGAPGAALGALKSHAGRQVQCSESLPARAGGTGGLAVSRRTDTLAQTHASGVSWCPAAQAPAIAALNRT